MGCEITLLKQVCVFATQWKGTLHKDNGITVTIGGKDISLDPANGDGVIKVRYSGKYADTTFPINLARLHTANEYVHRWHNEYYLSRWFTGHVAGVDDHVYRFEVSFDELMALKKSCRKVCDDHGKVPKLLPDNKYDEAYFKCVEETYKMLCGLGKRAEPNTFYLVTINY